GRGRGRSGLVVRASAPGSPVDRPTRVAYLQGKVGMPAGVGSCLPGQGRVRPCKGRRGTSWGSRRPLGDGSAMGAGDLLGYGYVLTGWPWGGWWHLHFGRSSWVYDCDLLGRRTDILASVQQFAPGGVGQSPHFLLTLDGEGVVLPAEEAGLDFQWG